MSLGRIFFEGIHLAGEEVARQKEQEGDSILWRHEYFYFRGGVCSVRILDRGRREDDH